MPSRSAPAVPAPKQAPAGTIRVGIGGWTFEPWRETFYPAGLPHAHELHYASRHLTSIEVNGTYHSLQKPASFARWRDDTPEGFVFSIKASRYCTNRKVLAEAGPAIERFIGSGLEELGPKLGPIVWQFMPTKAFDAKDFGAFLQLLPRQLGEQRLRHVLDVRHASFMCAEYLKLARAQKCATVFTDSDDYPSFADPTADFTYARLMRTQSRLNAGMTAALLDRWADAARVWATGAEPTGLPRVSQEIAEGLPAAPVPRDVFVYVISGAKERAPAAAQALLKRLGLAPEAASPA